MLKGRSCNLITVGYRVETAAAAPWASDETSRTLRMNPNPGSRIDPLFQRQSGSADDDVEPRLARVLNKGLVKNPRSSGSCLRPNSNPFRRDRDRPQCQKSCNLSTVYTK